MSRNSVEDMSICSSVGIKLRASQIALLLMESSVLSLLRDNALIRQVRGLKGIAQADARFYGVCAECIVSPFCNS